METNEWQSKLKQMIPSYGQSLAKDAELCRKTRKQTAEILGLVYRWKIFDYCYKMSKTKTTRQSHLIKRMSQETFSFSQQTWNRLKKNKAALIGLMIIAVAIFFTLFGYLVAPDGSPNADLQTVEIQAKKPGYSQLFLKIPDKKYQAVNWVSRLINGKPDDYRYLPIKSYTIKNDSLLINKYVDEDTAVVQYYSINQLTNNKPSNLASQNIITKKYLLGTDKFGRDILSRLIIGTRVSLAVGAIAVLISLTLGIILGALAGYYSGRVDAIIMWLVNVTWSIPTLLLVFAITMALGKGFWQIFIAVGLTMWVSVAVLYVAR
jgi:peptide/nickel transport system permease protein